MTSEKYKKYERAFEKARSILDTETYPQFCDKNTGMIDWEIVDSECIGEVVDYAFASDFLDKVDDIAQTLIDDSPINEPAIKIYYARRSKVRIVVVTCNCDFKCMDDVYELHNAVLKYLSNRDMETFRHEVGFE